MRNVKKFLALVLAMLMVVSAAATVSAFEDVADDHVFAAAINDLTVKEIVNGYDGETFGPDDAVTRQQMALMMARAITGNVGDDAVWAQGGLVGFEDVTEYQYAIATVVKAGIVDGFLDNTFRPEEGITFVQALKMAVCALGYDDGNLEWWNGYYNVALDLGLTENLNYITDADKALNRGEVAQLIYNMLYVELADGSDCFASQNFGLATSKNVTTFVITATDEQTAAYGMDVAEGGYVGIQALVNGLPDGDVYYIPVELFGFEEDEDEDYFLHAYNLVNWDAKNGSFSQIIPTGTYDVIYNADITVSTVKEKLEGKNKEYNKIKYDGVNYYAVDELSGTAIRNEVVIFNATDYSASASKKQLFLNADGQVLNADGAVILEAVYSVTGDIVSYRALREDPDTNVSKGAYLSVSKATELYGVDIGVTATPYTTMTASDLSGAYQLTIFDDDMDGKMDRAYFTPVYMAVKDGYTNTDQHLTAGPFEGWDESDYGKISGMEDLAEGDVFVYTFNEQLKEVTVLDVLEIATGTVKKVNTTYTDNKNYYYTTITLTDGTSLKMFNEDKKSTASVNAAIGANIWEEAGLDYLDEEGWIYQITDNQDFELVDDEFLLPKLEAGSLIRYYARNGYIVFAETYNIDDIFERVVLKEVIDADLEALYLDVYRNGEVEEIAVTKIWNTTKGEYVILEDLTWLQISRLLSNVTSSLEEGAVYRISELENGYQMSVDLAVVTDEKDEDYNADEFKLYAVDFTDFIRKDNVMTITDGVADAANFESTAQRANRLRTDEETIWYFIDADGNVKVFSGELDEASITIDGTVIFADKLGYTGTNKKGVANEVYVFNAKATTGFGWTAEYSSIVYMTYMDQNDKEAGYDYYNAGDAEEVGLNPKEYTASNYYAYSSSYAIDMYTGASYTVYSPFVLKNNTAYEVDDNGVVIKAATLETAKITLADIDWDDEYITIKSDAVLDFDAEVDALYARKVDTSTTRKTEKAIKDNILTDSKATYEILYVDGYANIKPDENVDEDGIFVIIVKGTTTSDKDEAVESNAYWYLDNEGIQTKDHHAVGTVTITDGDVAVELTTYNVWTSDALTTKSEVFAQNAADDAEIRVAIYKFSKTDKKYIPYLTNDEVDATVTYAKGVLKVSDFVYEEDNNIDVELDAGNYRLYVSIGSTDYAANNGKLCIRGIDFEIAE